MEYIIALNKNQYFQDYGLSTDQLSEAKIYNNLEDAEEVSENIHIDYDLKSKIFEKHDKKLKEVASYINLKQFHLTY